MGWSTTPPVLPEGSAWEQEATSTSTGNHWKIVTKSYIARLSGTGFALKVELTSSNGSYGTWYPSSYYSLRCDINGVTGTVDQSISVSKGTTTAYFTGDADEGVQVLFVISSLYTRTSTFTAPNFLAQPALWKKVSGVWTKVADLRNVTL